jgi:hypothetical protein
MCFVNLDPLHLRKTSLYPLVRKVNYIQRIHHIYMEVHSNLLYVTALGGQMCSYHLCIAQPHVPILAYILSIFQGCDITGGDIKEINSVVESIFRNIIEYYTTLKYGCLT